MAKKAVHSIYKTGESDIIAKKIIRFIKQHGKPQTTGAILEEALFTNDSYVRASWVDITIMVFQPEKNTTYSDDAWNSSDRDTYNS